MSSGISVWIKGLRLPLYWASGAPILLSAALASKEGHLTHLLFWALGSAALLVFELGVNMLAEVSDRNEGVFVTQANTILPTGPYLIESTGIAPEKLVRYAAVTFAVAGLIGIYLAAVTGFIVIILIGVAGLLLTFIYALPPFMLGVRGLGEPVPFIAFGPLPGLALYFLASGSISLTSVTVMLSSAFWITAVRYAHHLPDRSSKRGMRFENMHGKRVSYALTSLSVFLLLGIVSIVAAYPVAGAFILIPVAIAVPLSYLALRSTSQARGNAVEISRGSRYYVLLQFIASVGMALSMLIA